MRRIALAFAIARVLAPAVSAAGELPSGFPPVLRQEPGPLGGMTTIYDICAVKKGQLPKISQGCPFDIDKIGHDRSGYHIERASRAAEPIIIEQAAGIFWLCDDPPDAIYIAYSPYKDGVVMIVQRGILLAQRPIDRVLAKDYTDASKRWAPWPLGRGKGFSTCSEMGTPMKVTAPAP